MGNTGKTVSALAIDVNATGTWQAVAMNTSVTVNFASEGFYNINIRITYTDGTQKLGHTKLAVYASIQNSVSFTKPAKQRGSLCAADNFSFRRLYLVTMNCRPNQYRRQNLFQACLPQEI
jgi:hypothetical protein